MKKEHKKEYIEYEDGTRVLLGEDDVPELGEEFFKNAKYGLDGLAQLVGEEFIAPLRKIGRPQAEKPKKRVTIRLDSHVISAWRATGKGWQTRMNAFLRDSLPPKTT